MCCSGAIRPRVAQNIGVKVRVRRWGRSAATNAPPTREAEKDCNINKDHIMTIMLPITAIMEAIGA
jgi:hypothetical protein